MNSKQRTRRPGEPCPSCAHVYSRVCKTVPKSTGTERTRKCLNCGRRFSTRESVIAGRDTGVQPKAICLRDLVALFERLPRPPGPASE